MSCQRNRTAGISAFVLFMPHRIYSLVPLEGHPSRIAREGLLRVRGGAHRQWWTPVPSGDDRSSSQWSRSIPGASLIGMLSNELRFPLVLHKGVDRTRRCADDRALILPNQDRPRDGISRESKTSRTRVSHADFRRVVRSVPLPLLCALAVSAIGHATHHVCARNLPGEVHSAPADRAQEPDIPSLGEEVSVQWEMAQLTQEKVPLV